MPSSRRSWPSARRQQAAAPGAPKHQDTEIWEPVPKVVTPGATDAEPPSDAIVLFDGKNLDQWVSAQDKSPAKWTIADGVLVVVTPTTDHLAGLVADLDLLTVAPDKAGRVAEQLAPLEPSTQDVCEFELALSHEDVRALVGMGPSAWHIGAEALGERVAALPEPVRTTASVVVTAFRRA